jgi:hypothetical protein
MWWWIRGRCKCTVNSGEMEVTKTMGMDAGCPSMVVNMKLEPWLLDRQPWMEIEDVIVGCPFVVVNPWMKTDVVNLGEVEIIKTADVDVVYLSIVNPWMERKDMDAGCPFMVMNPWVKTNVEMEVI